MTAPVPTAVVPADNYPIVSQRALDPKERHGLFKLGKRSRGKDEVPRPNGHQVLVYRIGSRDVVDNGSLRLTDEEVVEATFVSLVDMRRDAQVFVRLMLPSRDDSEFALQVAFSCTVTDPVTVVRDGVVSAEPILRGYLRGHAKILELGLDFDLAQLNELRRRATAQVRAFHAVRPITVPGMKVTLAGVEVLTPEELKSLGNSLRTSAFDVRIESAKLQRDHELAIARLAHEREQAKLTGAGNSESLAREQERERVRLTFEQDQARLAREHEQALEAQRRRFEQEMRTENALPAPNAREALYLALANGSLDPEAYQAKLTELEEREFHRLQAAHQDAKAWEREKERLELQARLKLLELEEAHRRQELAWRRDDELRKEQYAREDHVRELDLKLNVLREFAKRGHLDLVNVNVDKLVADLVPAGTDLGGEAQPELGHEEKAALPSGEDEPDELQREAEVRDEDVD